MLKKDIKLFWPAIPSKEDILPDIEQLLWPENGERPFIGEGSLVEKFEQECSKKFGFDYVLFTNSGTSALDLALLGAGIRAGDEVISTPLTCTATNTPIIMRQARPVFADVQYDTANIEPKDIEHRITDKTKAIMVVHWGGYPSDMDEINKIAKKHNIKVIADGAHALGATYHRMPVSKFADYTMFSLQSIKQMTTIDGGLLAIPFKNSKDDLIKLSKDPKNRLFLRNIFGRKVDNYFKTNFKTKDIPEDYFSEEIFKEIKESRNLKEEFSRTLTENYDEFKNFWLDWQNAESLRRRRWFGIGREERVPAPKKGYSSYMTFESGAKFHGNNLDAIIGLASLKKIDEWQKRRNDIVKKYNSELENVPGITLFKQEDDRTSGNWLYNIHVKKRGDFIKTMASKGIETSVVHERNDYIPLFRGFSKGDYHNLKKVNEDRVCLPLHQELSDGDIKYIITSIKQGW